MIHLQNYGSNTYGGLMINIFIICIFIKKTYLQGILVQTRSHQVVKAMFIPEEAEDLHGRLKGYLQPGQCLLRHVPFVILIA